MNRNIHEIICTVLIFMRMRTLRRSIQVRSLTEDPCFIFFNEVIHEPFDLVIELHHNS